MRTAIRIRINPMKHYIANCAQPFNHSDSMQSTARQCYIISLQPVAAIASQYIISVSDQQSSLEKSCLEGSSHYGGLSGLERDQPRADKARIEVNSVTCQAVSPKNRVVMHPVHYTSSTLCVQYTFSNSLSSSTAELYCPCLSPSRIDTL